MREFYTCRADRIESSRCRGCNFRTPELDAEFAQHKENSLILLAPRWGPAGVRLKSKLYQGWLASLAHPWLTCLHASGVQNAARRAVGSLAPGGAKRHPGFESAMMIAPRQECEDPLAGHPEFLELRSGVAAARPVSP